jgi:hypothetical protein
MPKPLNVFLSYSRPDVEFARKLAADLAAEGHFEPWLDVTGIRIGDRWENAIRDAIASAELLLVLLSSSSVKSRSVIEEAKLAASSGKGRVIPVIIDERAKFAVPDFLQEIQWLDLSTPERYASGLRELSRLATTARRIKNEPDQVQGITLQDINVGGDIRLTVPHGPRMGDIIEVDDFVAKVVEKLRHQIPTGNEDTHRSSSINAASDPPSKLVFVVMSFEEDMDPIFEGIKAAAEAAGLEAKRVKDVIGDYKIDSKLIDMIHQACVVVVDLTHERPNVYFELGYARGIGKTVITTARRGTPLHFDVQTWTCDFYSDSRILEKRLIERFKIEWARLAANPAASSSG